MTINQEKGQRNGVRVALEIFIIRITIFAYAIHGAGLCRALPIGSIDASGRLDHMLVIDCPGFMSDMTVMMTGLTVPVIRNDYVFDLLTRFFMVDPKASPEDSSGARPGRGMDAMRLGGQNGDHHQTAQGDPD